MDYRYDEAFAKEMDQKDSLASYRSQFHIPQHNGRDVLYFTGNSLGLQPKKTEEYIQQELKDWKDHGVEGHFNAKRPWMPYHEQFTKSLARLTGAKEEEVVSMGTLTNNLHLLMVSFYRPTPTRNKILCEAKAFPSDQYALASQLRFHGYSQDSLLEIAPREGAFTLSEEDIYQAIEQQGDKIALLMMGGVNYYTGQKFDMQGITAAARAKGITVGWDLAHAMGNIELNLHDWDVDFAAWCTYKYVNSGPGAIAGIFVNERHLGNPDIPRFEGWWGHERETRFAMPDQFVPMVTAEAWQLSNAPVFSMAPQRASLDIFDSVDLMELRAKSKALSGYLEFVLKEVGKSSGNFFEMITPVGWEARGAQVSVFLHGQGRSLFDKLMENGVIADWREPNVIRMAPVPLYNTFMDVYEFGKILEKALI